LCDSTSDLKGEIPSATQNPAHLFLTIMQIGHETTSTTC